MKKILLVAIPALIINIGAYVIVSGTGDHSYGNDHDGATLSVGKLVIPAPDHSCTSRNLKES